MTLDRTDNVSLDKTDNVGLDKTESEDKTDNDYVLKFHITHTVTDSEQADNAAQGCTVGVPQKTLVTPTCDLQLPNSYGNAISVSDNQCIQASHLADKNSTHTWNQVVDGLERGRGAAVRLSGLPAELHVCSSTSSHEHAHIPDSVVMSHGGVRNMGSEMSQGNSVDRDLEREDYMSSSVDSLDLVTDRSVQDLCDPKQLWLDSNSNVNVLEKHIATGDPEMEPSREETSSAKAAVKVEQVSTSCFQSQVMREGCMSELTPTNTNTAGITFGASSDTFHLENLSGSDLDQGDSVEDTGAPLLPVSELPEASQPGDILFSESDTATYEIRDPDSRSESRISDTKIDTNINHTNGISEYESFRHPGKDAVHDVTSDLADIKTGSPGEGLRGNLDTDWSVALRKVSRDKMGQDESKPVDAQQQPSENLNDLQLLEATAAATTPTKANESRKLLTMDLMDREVNIVSEQALAKEMDIGSSNSGNSEAGVYSGHPMLKDGSHTCDAGTDGGRHGMAMQSKEHTSQAVIAREEATSGSPRPEGARSPSSHSPAEVLGLHATDPIIISEDHDPYDGQSAKTWGCSSGGMDEVSCEVYAPESFHRLPGITDDEMNKSSSHQLDRDNLYLSKNVDEAGDLFVHPEQNMEDDHAMSDDAETGACEIDAACIEGSPDEDKYFANTEFSTPLMAVSDSLPKDSDRSAMAEEGIPESDKYGGNGRGSLAAVVADPELEAVEAPEDRQVSSGSGVCESSVKAPVISPVAAAEYLPENHTVTTVADQGAITTGMSQGNLVVGPPETVDEVAVCGASRSQEPDNTASAGTRVLLLAMDGNDQSAAEKNCLQDINVDQVSDNPELRNQRDSVTAECDQPDPETNAGVCTQDIDPESLESLKSAAIEKPTEDYSDLEPVAVGSNEIVDPEQNTGNPCVQIDVSNLGALLDSVGSQPQGIISLDRPEMTSTDLSNNTPIDPECRATVMPGDVDSILSPDSGIEEATESEAFFCDSDVQSPVDTPAACDTMVDPEDMSLHHADTNEMPDRPIGGKGAYNLDFLDSLGNLTDIDPFTGKKCVRKSSVHAASESQGEDKALPVKDDITISCAGDMMELATIDPEPPKPAVSQDPDKVCTPNVPAAPNSKSKKKRSKVSREEKAIQSDLGNSRDRVKKVSVASTETQCPVTREAGVDSIREELVRTSVGLGAGERLGYDGDISAQDYEGDQIGDTCDTGVDTRKGVVQPGGEALAIVSGQDRAPGIPVEENKVCSTEQVQDDGYESVLAALKAAEESLLMASFHSEPGAILSPVGSRCFNSHKFINTVSDTDDQNYNKFGPSVSQNFDVDKNELVVEHIASKSSRESRKLAGVDDTITTHVVTEQKDRTKSTRPDHRDLSQTKNTEDKYGIVNSDTQYCRNSFDLTEEVHEGGDYTDGVEGQSGVGTELDTDHSIIMEAIRCADESLMNIMGIPTPVNQQDLYHVSMSLLCFGWDACSQITKHMILL